MRPYRLIMVSHPLTGKRIQAQEHVYIWLLANDLWQKGKTEPPKGHVIHHRDFNPRNNDIANLVLMSCPDHVKLHWDRTGKDRSRKVSEAVRKTYASMTPEQRLAIGEKGRRAAAEKMKKEGPTPAQLEAIRKARTFAYGGTWAPAKQLGAAAVAEIKRVYPEIKGKHGKVLALADRFGVSRRRLCRIALT